MKRRLYWAYGANLNHAGMQARCPRARPLGAFYRPGLALMFDGVATVRPGPQAAGGLWSITEHCEASLDQFEGWPDFYRKQYFDLQGETVMYYVMNSSDLNPPGSGYLAVIRQGYHDFGLDTTLLDQAVEHSCPSLETQI